MYLIDFADLNLLSKKIKFFETELEIFRAVTI
jgi:hypothetical protein